MYFLMVEQGRYVAESFATFLGKALVLSPYNLIKRDVLKIGSKYSLYGIYLIMRLGHIVLLGFRVYERNLELSNFGSQSFKTNFYGLLVVKGAQRVYLKTKSV